jgi:hypothetical protein
LYVGRRAQFRKEKSMVGTRVGQKAEGCMYWNFAENDEAQTRLLEAYGENYLKQGVECELTTYFVACTPALMEEYKARHVQLRLL